MLHREKAIAALTRRANDFKGYEAQQIKILESYQKELAALGNLNQDELNDELSSREWPGALPTVEQNKFNDVVVPLSRHGRTTNKHARGLLML